MKKIIIALIFVLSVYTITSQDFRILSEHNPPFSFSDRISDRGIAIELLREILENTGRNESADNIEFLPWARSYKIIQEEQGTILFPMARTEGRESLFNWVGPIYSLQIGVIARKEAGIIIGDAEDLNNYTIGTVRDGAPELLLLEKGVEKNHLDQAVSIELNLKKLVFGRVDLLAYNVPSTFYNLKKMGEDLNDYEVVYNIREVELYFAFHQAADPLIIKKLQDSLDHLKESEFYDEIISKYL